MNKPPIQLTLPSREFLASRESKIRTQRVTPETNARENGAWLIRMAQAEHRNFLSCRNDWFESGRQASEEQQRYHRASRQAYIIAARYVLTGSVCRFRNGQRMASR